MLEVNKIEYKPDEPSTIMLNIQEQLKIFNEILDKQKKLQKSINKSNLVFDYILNTCIIILAITNVFYLYNHTTHNSTIMLPIAIFTPIFAYLNGRSTQSGKQLSHNIKEQVLLTEHTINLINDQLKTEYEVKAINEHYKKVNKGI
jgi:hypothetical protein